MPASATSHRITTGHQPPTLPGCRLLDMEDVCSIIHLCFLSPFHLHFHLLHVGLDADMEDAELRMNHLTATRYLFFMFIVQCS
jgi:hypothetical protein